MTSLIAKCKAVFKTVFVSVEPHGCSCVFVLMLLFVYNVFLPDVLKIPIVFRLYDKNLLG